MGSKRWGGRKSILTDEMSREDLSQARALSQDLSVREAMSSLETWGKGLSGRWKSKGKALHGHSVDIQNTVRRPTRLN